MTFETMRKIVLGHWSEDKKEEAVKEYVLSLPATQKGQLPGAVVIQPKKGKGKRKPIRYLITPDISDINSVARSTNPLYRPAMKFIVKLEKSVDQFKEEVTAELAEKLKTHTMEINRDA